MILDEALLLEIKGETTSHPEFTLLISKVVPVKLVHESLMVQMDQ